jgi:hypothetical protein
MEQISFQLLPADIGATSSMEQLKTEFKRVGLLVVSSDRVNDVHFQDFILPASLKTVADVRVFFAKLDAEARHKHGGECEKAKAARKYIKCLRNPNIPLLRWTMRALADARRTPCDCHELGTYHAL